MLAKDISRLFREWDDRTSAQVIVKGVHVPYRYWGRLYRDIAPKSWKVLNKHSVKPRFVSFESYLHSRFLELIHTENHGRIQRMRFGRGAVLGKILRRRQR